MRPADAPLERVLVRLRAPLRPGQARRLDARLRVLLRGGVREVVCTVSGADLGVVDALARLHLLARRAGVPLRVRVVGPPASSPATSSPAGGPPGASSLSGGTPTRSALADLLVLTGLDGVLGPLVAPRVAGGGGSQPRGQAEPGEQRRVEEVVHVRDAAP